MEILLLVVVIFAVIIIATLSRRNASVARKIHKKNTYFYRAKNLMMTRTEADFFLKLESAVKERYYVFPQVHLSAILDHKVNGQDWSYAFKHINGKSVDYVLCDRQTLRPTYAIELDDYTHNAKDRVARDAEVERMFRQVNLPLVRFRNKDVFVEEIIESLASARG